MVSAREPLQDDDLRTFLDAADAHADAMSEPEATRDRMFAYALPNLGMRASALAHMTREWVDFQERTVRVPAFQECTAGRYGEPCSECEKRLELIRDDPDAVDTYADHSDRRAGQASNLYARARRFKRYADREGLNARLLDGFLDEHTGMWFPKTGRGHRPIPVKDDDTWDLISHYFQFHDEVMVTRQTVGNVVDRVARRSDLRRQVLPHELRHTYGTRLAAMEFTSYEIRDAMGHKTIKQAEDYIRIAGKRLDDAFATKWESV